MTSWQSLNRENQEMVDKFTRLAIIRSKEVENAFRCVNRAAFVFKELFSEAFTDAPLRGAPHLHMSAPNIYATILEDLELEPGMSFLNIGSGTGYFSCLAGYMIKPSGINHGIEIHEDMVEFAQERVNDLMNNGPADTSEICRPLFITGNAFRLDPNQMKYDRLYCGGACPQTSVTFFLEFLKVGGFLIVPIGAKLIKLERVSHQEGVKTVLSDVCFRPLTRLDSNDRANLRAGTMPFIRFPIKTRKKKPKKLILPSVNFPVSSSQARKKLARMRAIQHALGSLEKNGQIPPAFCYVPELNQINNYKQYKKLLECKGVVDLSKVVDDTSKGSTGNRNALQESSSSTSLLTALQNSENNIGLESTVNPHLMTVHEFLLFSFSQQETQRHSTASKETIEKEIIEYSDHDFDVSGKISKDVWEHLCSDKLWENVMEYYYSVCSTKFERKKKCFELKGVHIQEPNVNKFADTLLFKMSKRAEKKEKLKNDLKFVDSEKTVINLNNATDSNFDGVDLDVNQLVNELIENVCESLNPVEDEKPKQKNKISTRLKDAEVKRNSCVRKRETLSSSSSTTKPGTCKQFIDIKTDVVTAEKLSTANHVKWTRKHDLDLIDYLVFLSKNNENQSRSSMPRELSPDMFDQSKLIKFPSLSTVASDVLCSRAIGLQRVAKVLDSVLEILVGPSLKRDQFENPFETKYPLVSFTDKSFECSDSQLNVAEAQENQEEEILKKKKEESEVVDDDAEVSYQEALSPEDEEMLKEVQSMVMFELSNVHQQQMILVKKVRLIDNIDEQYKEQVKLLNQQVQLIDEQQRLLVDVELEAGRSERPGGQTSQQLVLERKQQRQSLLVKRDRINTERESQMVEKKEILSMLEQLLTLDSRLKNELKSLKTKGMGYLKGVENDLSSFSKFVQKADTILKKLRVSSTKIREQSGEENENEKEKEKEKKEETLDDQLSYRYHPETILPRCRFLLPLSRKRHTFVKEMLRSTERSASSTFMPIIRLDRRIPVNERYKHDESSTVFMQIYYALKNKDLHYRWNKRSYSQWWEVKFNGEGIIDQGGGFRDSLTEMSDELCPMAADQKSCLPLFIRTPNQGSKIGDYLDCYTLNPSCRKFPLYRWLGQLFGACFRTSETIPLALPPYIWKLLVGEHVTWKDDFVHVDEAAVHYIDGLNNLEDDAYKALHIEQTFSTTLSDQTEFDLVPNGSEIIVQCKDRYKYSTMVRKARMMENIKQIEALREGLLTVLPEAVLSCLTWNRLERGVCGSPNISVTELKTNCRYGDRLSSTSPSIVHMWSALSSFTDEERSRFLRFITGRKRLPSPFIVFRSSLEEGSPDSALPSASTCGSNLFLPEYSSAEIAKEKLRYAIYNCVAIDTDTSPW